MACDRLTLRRPCALLLLLIGLCGALPAAADWRPERLTILLSDADDGAEGRLVRALARTWSRALGAPVNVTSFGRRGALVAAAAFLKAPRDGTVVLAGDLARLAVDYGRERPAWRWANSFEHLSVVALDPAVIMAPDGDGYADLGSVAASARSRDVAVAVGRWQSVDSILILDAARQAGLRLSPRPVGSGESIAAALAKGAVGLAVGRLSGLRRHGAEIRQLATIGAPGANARVTAAAEEAMGAPLLPAGRIDAITVHADLQRNFPERFERLMRTAAAAVSDEDFLDVLDDAERLKPDRTAPVTHADLMVWLHRVWDAQARIADALAVQPEPVRTRGLIEKTSRNGRRLRYLGLDGKRHDMLAHPLETELLIDGKPVDDAEPLARIERGMLCEIAWPGPASVEASWLSCRMPRGTR